MCIKFFLFVLTAESEHSALTKEEEAVKDAATVMESDMLWQQETKKQTCRLKDTHPSDWLQPHSDDQQLH